VTNLRVLVVDDDLSLYERIQAYCAAKAPDVTVLSAISGARATAIAASQHPDVILVDADIPDDDGYLLCAKLRDSHELLDAQIVMLAGTADDVAAVRAKDAGAVAVLASGADPSEILATIQRVTTKPTASSTRPTAGVAVPAEPRIAVSARPAPPGARADDLNVDDLLRLLLKREGSDLHLTAGSPPGLRIRGDIHPVEGCDPLTPKDTQDLILTLLSEEQRRRFDADSSSTSRTRSRDCRASAATCSSNATRWVRCSAASR